MNYVTEAIKRQPFASKAEMDATIKLHLGEHGANLNDSTVEILHLLSRYGCKYPGVAFLKYVTIAKAIGKSRMTVMRNIKVLVNAGIIEKVSFMRAINGGCGANMYVIQSEVKATSETSNALPRVELQESTGATVEAGNGENEPCIISKRDQKKYMLDTDLENIAARNNIPTVLYNALSPFFQGAELRKYVGIVFRAKTAKVRLEAHTDEFKACIADCIRRLKNGTVRNLDGYLYKAIRKLSRNLFLA